MKTVIRSLLPVLFLTLIITACSGDIDKNPQPQKQDPPITQDPNIIKDEDPAKDDEGVTEEKELIAVSPSVSTGAMKMSAAGYNAYNSPEDYVNFNTEDYNTITENTFLAVTDNPLSTFSIDVDAASYSNMRRFITNSQLPPKDAVRIEEMINYFSYDYSQPTDGHPFSIITEVGNCPWNKKTKLLHLGLQGIKIPTENLPPSNLVFLLDVSGSMEDYNKLPLLKSAFKLLVSQLRPVDKVSIVVYAGAAGVVLPPTDGNEKTKILDAIDRLQAGGSTAGAEGIELAYQLAQENFTKTGNNRVVLATDGDFNVGVSSDAELVRMIEKKRDKGIFLTVLGFGMGNYKDNKMEQLADKGNGNYAYVDNITEAKKVLVNEFGGTLFTIAKDVKIQIEFNPAKIKAYRLIGYENRLLNKEDFNNDKKDAGEMGSGHTVTALYEIVTAESDIELPGIDPLKYQTNQVKPDAANSSELMTIKFRYKEPKDTASKLIVKTVEAKEIKSKNFSDNFEFSAAVAEFGMMLRDSEFKGESSFDSVIKMAKNSLGKDEEGYRYEFVKLVEQAKLLVAVDDI